MKLDPGLWTDLIPHVRTDTTYVALLRHWG
jgi:hypothetical protein